MHRPQLLRVSTLLVLFLGLGLATPYGGRAQTNDSERVLVTLSDGSQVVGNVTTGQVDYRAAGQPAVVLWTGAPETTSSWSASPDGRWISWIVLVTRDNPTQESLTLWERASHQATTRTSDQLGFLPAWDAGDAATAWSPSSQRLLVMGVTTGDPPYQSQLYGVGLTGAGAVVVPASATRDLLMPLAVLGDDRFYYLHTAPAASWEQLWFHAPPGPDQELTACAPCDIVVQGGQIIQEVWDFTSSQYQIIHRWDLATGAPVPDALPGTGAGGSVTFPATGQTLRGLFLPYWTDHGGLAQQGYPISPLLTEVSPLDGQAYTVQYFERAVFELHPENAAPYNVLLSQLGTFRYHALYPHGASGQHPAPGGTYIPQTGHTLGGVFAAYWQSHGGLAQQGYPISDEFREVSPLDGQPYTVQYFERAMFEWHPANAPPYNVLLGQLGTFRYRQLYPPAP
ncbi:MAG TPA: hypothetical protein VKY74_28360 [Chloroflexia bacterium]|nr:hypothetical protein [Chloroflexia bacterium]